MADELEPEVRRVPIVLGSRGIALLTLFKLPHDKIDDCWAWDWIQEEMHTQYIKSAKQFIAAMEGHWSPAFLMALGNQIKETLAGHDAKYGTEFEKRVDGSAWTTERRNEASRLATATYKGNQFTKKPTKNSEVP